MSWFDAPENSRGTIAQLHVKTSRWPVFTHFSLLRRIWEYLGCLISAFSLFEISFTAIFSPGIDLYSYIPFLCFDFLYLIDLYVSTHTAYLSHGVLVYNPRRIRRRIGNVWLSLRIIAAFPIGWIGCLVPRWWVHLILGVPKILRLHRAIEAADTVARSLVYSSWFSMLFPLCLLLVGLIHLFACLFYLTHFFEGSLESWVNVLGWGALTTERQYVVSIYFVMTTIFTAGTGDVTPQTSAERMVVIFIQLIGVIVNAYIVGMMVSFLIDPIGSNFLSSFAGLWSYLKFKRIPEELRSEILNVFQDKWHLYKGSDEPRSVFKFIPETVRDHLKLDITRTCFMKISMMQMATEKLLVAFANVMNPFSACPGEILIKQGETQPILFLFRSGVIQVFINDALFATNNCDTGIGMGELELLVDSPRELTVRAVTYVEGWALHRRDLVMCMTHQMDLRNELLEICKMVFPAFSTQIRNCLQVGRRAHQEAPAERHSEDEG
jgi:CRP-like cAMP-binding protein